MSTWADKHKTALTCCQFNDSVNSISVEKTDLVCETKNNFVKIPCNNSKNSSLQDEMNNRTLSSKQSMIDLEFENLTYSVSTWSWSIKKFPKVLQKKKLLHGVSGEFKYGELSVIIGPSGAGKSTLLNILSGFKIQGSTGHVKLNGTNREKIPMCNKLSAYIPQEDELRLALTVKESMSFAVHLKLGYNVSMDYKMQKIYHIAEILGLSECKNTLTSKLSGGQRKRLAIALELINNPKIIFLDEPTSGLDSSACIQCISLFKKLAREGRTIIATIHQPSALIFETFDKVYALSQGKCIYDGKPSQLVEQLASMDLHCPPYHNPADFLIEVATGEHGADIQAMAKKVKASQLLKKNEINNISNKKACMLLRKSFNAKDQNISTDEKLASASIIMQFLLLYKRNLITTKRIYGWVLNRLLAHVVIGFIFGYLYQGVGKGANTILGNYVYIYGTLLFTAFTGKMPVSLCFPLEIKMLRREHFNRWYKLSPYLLSIILLEIPFQVICVWTYVVISYWFTEQPLDFRCFFFAVFVTACSLCAQSMGYLIGATTTIKIAVFIGPVLTCFLSIFGFCIRSFDTPVYFKWVFNLSYYRAAFQSVVYTIYSFGRPRLFCPEESDYCHYQDPQKFLKEMDMMDTDLMSNITLIIFFSCFLHAATYVTLWIKLNKR